MWLRVNETEREERGNREGEIEGKEKETSGRGVLLPSSKTASTSNFFGHGTVGMDGELLS